MSRYLIIGVLFGLLSCGSHDSIDDQPQGLPTQPLSDAATQTETATDTAMGTDTDTAIVTPDESIPTCVPGCVTASDCDMGTPAYSSDNYSCDDSVCVYLGCHSDAECTKSIPGSVCVENDLGSNYCVIACVDVGDCDMGVAAYDTDNYECVSGGCDYTGCNSDAECAELSPDYVCRSQVMGTSFCVMGCQSANDCDLGVAAYDADNYECVSGGCEYTGCLSDAECEALDSDSVCQ